MYLASGRLWKDVVGKTVADERHVSQRDNSIIRRSEQVRVTCADLISLDMMFRCDGIAEDKHQVMSYLRVFSTER